VLVDRPITEVFVNNGRASHVAASPFSPGNASIALYNGGTSALTVAKAAAYSMVQLILVVLT
jgi:hypothetical protein